MLRSVSVREQLLGDSAKASRRSCVGDAHRPVMTVMQHVAVGACAPRIVLGTSYQRSKSLQEAVEGDDGQREEQPVRLLQPDPALPCDAERLHINRAGTYALVYGHASDSRVCHSLCLCLSELRASALSQVQCQHSWGMVVSPMHCDVVQVMGSITPG